MIYIVVCFAALLICFAIGFGIMKLITRGKRNVSLLKKAILTFLFGVALMVMLGTGYLSVFHKAEQRAMDALKGNQAVAVTAVDGGYFFDGPEGDTAMIFYPGAKVACEAYAPLMLEIAESGIDCFLADMPFNFAVFGGNNAEKFLDTYQYKSWIMSGHSMGGMVAADYAAKHPERINGLVLLAAYPPKRIENGMAFLSIYGSEDGCLNRKEYEKDRVNQPDAAEELIIEGGNHAQFGDYGTQQRDGEASMTREEQQKITAECICGWSESAILPRLSER